MFLSKATPREERLHMADPGDTLREFREMYDSYIKTALRNCARNYVRNTCRKETHEVLSADPMRYLRSAAHSGPDVTIAERFAIPCRGTLCTLTDEKLYFALLSLPENQRAVLLCDIWLEMTDAEIAGLYHVTVRTVYNWRQRALRRLKSTYVTGASD